MILGKKFISVKFIGSDPSKLFISTFVSSPVNIVPKWTMTVMLVEFRIQYFGNLKFFLAINLDWGRRRLCAIWNRVLDYWLELGYMENWVDTGKVLW